MIPLVSPVMNEYELNNVTEAVKSGWISSKGKFVSEFENKFAKFCGTKYGLATSNGTAALHLALKALDISEGDEVILPTLTFIATANAVAYCNAKPVFVDSHPDYWCIDPTKIEEKITDKTKAIIPVHLYGHPCDMDPIIKLAKDYDLYIIEDAAEAHGAEYRGRKVGSFGDINCFSFYGNKVITTGEGGMCLTNNEELRDKMIVLRDHGMTRNKKYWHDVIGFNYRMTNMQAAVGVAQIDKINDIIDKKRKVAGMYKKILNKSVIHPPEMHWAKNCFWLYSILLPTHVTENTFKTFSDNGIETRPIFYPVTDMPPYKSEEIFPVAREISNKGISLPSNYNLTEEEIKNIADVINEICN